MPIILLIRMFLITRNKIIFSIIAFKNTSGYLPGIHWFPAFFLIEFAVRAFISAPQNPCASGKARSAQT